MKADVMGILAPGKEEGGRQGDGPKEENNNGNKLREKTNILNTISEFRVI